MKLHVVKGRPRNLQEAIAHATEVDAVMETDNRKSSQRTRDVRGLGSGEDDLAEELKKLQADLARTQEAQRDVVVRKKNREEAS